ncbi:hypothetical protein mRhiFer1_008794 [Rhinolophus ferrumequinum]|uniref:Uncharacterized protein n=1 Tax=Rhinolophus ferrumequinum TaxID=59479 RepID=A0A7J8AEH1_RHIFE|nr:hypothetical protein mRhiFer1_008794 [Rhinolophus ferrumequinum]
MPLSRLEEGVSADTAGTLRLGGEGGCCCQVSSCHQTWQTGSCGSPRSGLPFPGLFLEGGQLPWWGKLGPSASTNLHPKCLPSLHQGLQAPGMGGGGDLSLADPLAPVGGPVLGSCSTRIGLFGKSCEDLGTRGKYAWRVTGPTCRPLYLRAWAQAAFLLQKRCCHRPALPPPHPEQGLRWRSLPSAAPFGL